MAIFIVTYQPVPSGPTVQEVEGAFPPICASIPMMRGVWLLQSDSNARWLADQIKVSFGGKPLPLFVARIEPEQGVPDIGFDEGRIDAPSILNFVSTR